MGVHKKIDEQIEALQKQIEALKSLRTAIDLVGESKISSLFESHESSTRESLVRRSDGGSSNYDLVVSFFKTRNNEWADTTEIREATGLDRGNLSNVLYVASKDNFESREHPEHGRKRIWRLREKPSLF